MSWQFSAAFNVDPVVPIYKNVRDAGFFRQRFQWTESKHLIENLLDDPVLFGGRHRDPFVIEQAFHYTPDFDPETVARDRVDSIHVERANQLFVDLGL